VELVTAAVPWPVSGRARRAGVSSFGISGTNAHVILEQAPDEPVTDGETDAEWIPLVLSATSPEALRAQAVAVRERLTGDAAALRDIAWSLATTRSSLKHRAVVVGTDRDELGEELAALSESVPSAGLHQGVVRAGRTAVVFGGQGSQRAGMGRELYETHPAFATALDEVCAYIDPLLGRSLRDIMFDDTDLLHRTEFAQPALFAVEYALYQAMSSVGVTADHAIGHSIGEITAACVAGVVTLSDAARMVVARGGLMQALPSNEDASGAGGSMAAIEATEDEVRARLVGEVGLAAVNGPRSVVVSGVAAAVERVVSHFADRGRRTTVLQVSHAFHSSLLDPMLDEFEKICASISFSPPRIALISNLTGEVLTAEQVTTPEYWVRHARETVRFVDGVRTLAARGVTRYVVIDPNAALVPMVRECLADDDPGLVVATLRGGRSESATVLAALADLYVDGVPVSWDTCLPIGRSIDLPTYQFQRKRFWAEPSAARLPVRVEGQAAAAATYVHEWISIPSTGRAPGVPRYSVIGAVGDNAGGIGAGCSDLRTIRDSAADVPEVVVAYLRAAPGPMPERAHEITATALELVQYWMTEERFVDSRLVVVTSGAVAVAPGDDIADAAAAPLCGLLRSAHTEHPGRIVHIDLDVPTLPDEHLGAALNCGESEVAIRGDRLSVRRLTAAVPSAIEYVTDPEDTILITGAAGALGGVVARHLVRRYSARHLVLVSRRGPDSPELLALRTELAELGAEIDVIACDVSDRDAVADMLTRLPRRLGAIVHAAGLLDDGAILSLDRARLSQVLRPKIDGAWHLHELTRDLQLDRFILFSSAAALIGTAGQANYAAANAFLDALAHHRRACGLPATSVAWGLWEHRSGMGGRLDSTQRDRLTQAGVVAMTTEQATAMFDAVLHSDEPVLAPMRLDLSALGPSQVPPVLRGLAAGTESSSQAPRLPDLAALPATRRREVMLGIVLACSAAVLGHRSPAEVSDEQAFTELGFDSLTAVELRNQLTARTGLALPPSLVYDYPTPLDLANFLIARLVPRDSPPAERVMQGLDSVEQLLVELNNDDNAVTEITGRLQAILRKIKRDNDNSAGALAVVDNADDILDFIDREFGDLSQ
ncbi:SDR family NAD(P)-dependent oxidoreductase, partial [Nocardia sp. NPDC055002]